MRLRTLELCLCHFVDSVVVLFRELAQSHARAVMIVFFGGEPGEVTAGQMAVATSKKPALRALRQQGRLLERLW